MVPITHNTPVSDQTAGTNGETGWNVLEPPKATEEEREGNRGNYGKRKGKELLSCTRFLNNIHFSDTMYCVTIVNLTKYGSTSPKSDHVVVDLLCSLEDVPIEKMTAKYLSLNHS
ncbi:unnamed protein product [Heligmosomoides polygyrus]|uniref:Fibronectin type-III domain-containing protein n=1 Tax=Heligmosomoides polygyrus TaxID=6339 RepID=A0A183GEZ9_HELPZ|nr:unnamed protein product [Heligmosomoides polygyrus]